MSQRAISYMSASNCTCRIYNGSNRDCQESVVDAYLSAVSNCCVSRHARLSPFTFSSSPHFNFPFVLIAHTRFLICITHTRGSAFISFLSINFISLPSSFPIVIFHQYRNSLSVFLLSFLSVHLARYPLFFSEPCVTPCAHDE